jgi:hypothetical protein
MILCILSKYNLVNCLFQIQYSFQDSLYLEPKSVLSIECTNRCQLVGAVLVPLYHLQVLQSEDCLNSLEQRIALVSRVLTDIYKIELLACWGIFHAIFRCDEQLKK